MHSLRFKLSWTNSVVLAVVVLVVGWVRFTVVSYRVYERFDDNLVSDASFLARHLVSNGEAFELSMAGLSSIDAFRLESLEAYCIITDTQGHVLHPLRHTPAMQRMMEGRGLDEILRRLDGMSEAETPDGRRFRLANLRIGSSKFVVHLARDADQLSEFVSEYRAILITSVPYLLGISVLIGWLLAGRALRPFNEVVKTVEQITSRSLNTQISDRYKEREVQSLVDSFNAMVSRLENSFRQMTTFNADVAHELRTPLAVLQGETEIALNAHDVPDEIRAVLGSNLEELQRLARIVADMLTLAEAESGTRVLSPKQVDVRDLVSDLVEQMRLPAAEAGVEITLDQPQDVKVMGDEMWLRRAVLNVLDNAIKYSPQGGRVFVELTSHDSLVTLAVRDEGIGIAHDDLPRIFDRMYRADPARRRSTGGSGLGLSLVKWIVEVHGGRVHVESRLDHGSTFALEFPRVPANSTAEETGVQAHEVRGGSAQPGSVTGRNASAN